LLGSGFAQIKNTDTINLRFDVIMRDGGVFHGAVPGDKTVYIVTEYARMKLTCEEIDSVETGILPAYSREKKIRRMLKELGSEDMKLKEEAYNRLMNEKAGALPVIRHYIKESGEKDTVSSKDKYTPVNVLKLLLAKFRLEGDFPERDIIYMNKNFRLGGVFTMKRRIDLIKFGRYEFERGDIKEIIFLR
jgi:hypothetical protein